MKITTDQLNEYTIFYSKEVGRSYYNNEQEAIEEIKRYNKETTNCYATLCTNNNIKYQ